MSDEFKIDKDKAIEFAHKAAEVSGMSFEEFCHTIPELTSECIICGKGVTLTNDEITMLDWGKPIPPKVCDKCKQAIIRMRNYIQAEDFFKRKE